MTILEKLTDDMKTAMKAGDKARLSTVRMLISAIRYVGIDAGELSEEQVIAVLQKEAKKRRESIAAYTTAGRTESAEAEKAELAIIETYLPQMMSEDEVRIRLTVNGAQLTAAANFGEAMKIAMQELKGQADGGVVSKVVKELYQQ